MSSEADAQALIKDAEKACVCPPAARCVTHPVDCLDLPAPALTPDRAASTKRTCSSRRAPTGRRRPTATRRPRSSTDRRRSRELTRLSMPLTRRARATRSAEVGVLPLLAARQRMHHPASRALTLRAMAPPAKFFAGVALENAANVLRDAKSAKLAAAKYEQGEL